MNTHLTMAEALVSAIRTLPKHDRKIILEELIIDVEKDFTQAELDKLEKLSNKKGKTFKSSGSFLKALSKI